MMTLDEIRQILDMVREHSLAEFELEQEGVKLRIRKEGGMQLVSAGGLAPTALLAAAIPSVPPGAAAGPFATAGPSPAAANGDGPDDEGSVELAVIKSPMVGTFYRAPEPSASSFVEAGQVVRKGQVVCIIEAMKLMNEIESEYEGELVKIYVENGQPVQYGERLFAIKVR